MPIHPKVIELLRQWETSRKQGTILTAEQLCQDCPEHINELAQHINAYQERPPVSQANRSRMPVMQSSGTHQALRTGQLPVLENYEVLNIIGKGGMGIVYKVEQKWPRRIVALKMLRSQTVVESDDLDRFNREIETLGRLEHPNIVHLYDAGHLNGHPYFIMEFVDGSNLSELYKDKGCSPKRAARIVSVLARAVQDAHDQGILHRDLKPANILLKKNGMPKITDFGLAKRLEQRDDGQTPSYMVLGTPSYMAPEQAGARSDDIGYPTDVYGLGAILYELMTGKPPFKGETPHETLIFVLTQKPTPPGQLNRNIPEELNAICLKCLEKEPRNRYATAKELAEALDHWIQTGGSQTKGPSLNWRMIALVVSMLLFLGAIVYRFFLQ